MEFIVEEIEVKLEPEPDLDHDTGAGVYPYLATEDWKLNAECKVRVEKLKDSPLRNEFPRDFDETCDPYFKFKLLVEELLDIFTKSKEKCSVCVEYILKLCQHIGQAHDSPHEHDPTASNSWDFIRHHVNHLNSVSSEPIPIPSRIIYDSEDISPPVTSSSTTSEQFSEAIKNNSQSQNASAGPDHDEVDLECSVSSLMDCVEIIQVSGGAPGGSTHRKMDETESECEEVFSSLNDSNVDKSFSLPFTCEKCGEGFSRQKYLISHMKSQHGYKKIFKCDVCGKNCTQSTHLRTHMRTHMRTHTGEKPHKCDECKKSFSTLVYLTSHKRIHTGEKPFKCEECGKCFTHSASLKYH